MPLAHVGEKWESGQKLLDFLLPFLPQTIEPPYHHHQLTATKSTQKNSVEITTPEELRWFLTQSIAVVGEIDLTVLDKIAIGKRKNLTYYEFAILGPTAAGKSELRPKYLLVVTVNSDTNRIVDADVDQFPWARPCRWS